MAVAWPSTLPQAPASFGEQPASNIVRSDPDTGPSKTRRRFTKAKRSANLTFLMTIEQYAILENFFTQSLLDGAVAMIFVHPWRQVPVSMYIKEPPQYTNEDVLGVSVSFPVEYF